MGGGGGGGQGRDGRLIDERSHSLLPLYTRSHVFFPRFMRQSKCLTLGSPFLLIDNY